MRIALQYRIVHYLGFVACFVFLEVEFLENFESMGYLLNVGFFSVDVEKSSVLFCNLAFSFFLA